MKDKCISKLKWLIDNLPMLLGAVAITAAVTVCGVNALTRYIFKYTIWGSSEYISLAFIWLIFCGAAAAYKQKMHFGLDLLVVKLPHSWQLIVALVGRVLTLAIMGISTYLAWVLTSEVGTKFMVATKISYFWYDLSAVVAFGLMTIYTAQFILEDIRELTGGKEQEHES